MASPSAALSTSAVRWLAVSAVWLAPVTWCGAQSPGPTAPVAALSAYIDVHTHLDPPDVDGAVAALTAAMPLENLQMAVFMPSPFVIDSPGRFEAEILAPLAERYPGRIAFLGGGGSLNPMLQQAVAQGAAGPDVAARFRARAEEILRLGAKGFGEIATEHFPTSTPYESVPPDHPLMLLLADVAAAHDVPISMHMEALPEEIAAPAELGLEIARLPADIPGLERLLAHNRGANIVWAHMGWDLTGFRTPELARRLLGAHPNLYMELKVDPVVVGRNSPLVDGGSGAIKPEWLDLISDFPDRFLMGTDTHYPMPAAGPQRWQADVLLLNQLPEGVRERIASGNAIRLYHLR
jgi:predicted TIM-barrel fold metal-dependent hydrolase